MWGSYATGSKSIKEHTRNYRCGTLGAGEYSLETMARARSGAEPKQFTEWECGTQGRSFRAVVSAEDESFVGTSTKDGTDDSGRYRKELQWAGSPGAGLACPHHPGHEFVATGARYPGGHLTGGYAELPAARARDTETQRCRPVERAT